MTENALKKELEKICPNCVDGFLDELLRCARLHSSKNADYNGTSELYLVTGVKGRIADVWRKMIRVMTLGWFDNAPKVPNETLLDTTQDLTVYSILLTVELRKLL